MIFCTYAMDMDFSGGLGLDFGARALGCNDDPDVSRKYQASDDGHGRPWTNFICMYSNLMHFILLSPFRKLD